MTVAIDRLKALVGGTTWRIVQVVPTDKGELAIDLERDQTTDSATVIELTKEALQLEEKSGARYDGWGTIAKAKTELVVPKVWLKIEIAVSPYPMGRGIALTDMQRARFVDRQETIFWCSIPQLFENSAYAFHKANIWEILCPDLSRVRPLSLQTQ